MGLSKLLIFLIFFVGIAVGEVTVYDDEEVISVAIAKDQGLVTNVLSSFVFYDSYSSLWDAFPEYAGQIEAICFCDRQVELNMAWCEIHVVEPTVIDGEHTLSLGHEVLHGVFGENYHEWVLVKYP